VTRGSIQHHFSAMQRTSLYMSGIGPRVEQWSGFA